MKRNKDKAKRKLLSDAKAGGSPVAVAAFARGGAGKHGHQGDARHRADRRSAKQALRRGDW